jgi:hypothetical protein
VCISQIVIARTRKCDWGAATWGRAIGSRLVTSLCDVVVAVVEQLQQVVTLVLGRCRPSCRWRAAAPWPCRSRGHHAIAPRPIVYSFSIVGSCSIRFSRIIDTRHRALGCARSASVRSSVTAANLADANSDSDWTRSSIPTGPDR